MLINLNILLYQNIFKYKFNKRIIILNTFYTTTHCNRNVYQILLFYILKYYLKVYLK